MHGVASERILGVVVRLEQLRSHTLLVVLDSTEYLLQLCDVALEHIIFQLNVDYLFKIHLWLFWHIFWSFIDFLDALDVDGFQLVW